MKIKLMTDSTCDMSNELLERYQVCEVVQMGIALGEKSCKDNEIDSFEIYDYINQTKKLPKTCAVNTYELTQAFERHTADGSALIYFSISNLLSASHQNAVNAAKEFKNVHIVNSKQLSTGTALLLMHAYDLIESKPSLTAKEVADAMNAMADKVQSSFIVDTIDCLYHGGRCSALALLGANLLKIHPSLHLKEGQITVGKKYRGKMTKVASEYIEDLRDTYNNHDDTRCFITYTKGTDAEVINAVKERAKEFFNFKEILETTAGSTITCHCGKGTIGLLFINK